MKKSHISSPLTKRLLTTMGNNIKMARLRRGLSLRAVAERAGLALNTLVSIEKGASGASIGAVGNVLHALGLAQDISLLAKDDELGHKLQDLQIQPKKRAPKKRESR